MIVDMDRVLRASHLYVSAAVDRQHLDSAEVEAMTLVRNWITRSLLEEIQVYGFDAHARDVSFAETEDFVRTTVRVTAQWWPTTDEVILHGGPKDGERLAVPEHIRRTRLVVCLSGPSGFDAMNEVVPLSHCDYALFGWDDVNQCWVMSVKGVVG
ncbi:hypothetical protein QNM97_13870 [Gordonia sp. L191]|uniref:hypothetical protein n=1 Tax=Gordonia sp. L191 TaxID=2982699 RepID=UPI0024C004F0|nr:hypothetical protein [Gordonia sp. L191]WHU45139.1 hypothetical protein QNM97_13870 [Gordonia sp. L191]